MSTDALKWARTQMPRLPNGNPDGAAKCILLVLCDHANVTAHETFVAAGTISRESGFGETAVGKALARMDRDGYISRRKKYLQNGHRTSDQIQINLDKPPDDLTRPKRQEPPELARARLAAVPRADTA